MTAFPLRPSSLVGWVMRRNRWRLQEVTGMRTAEFIDELRAQGITVDNSRLSRWEMGHIVPIAQVLAAYEQVCGLPAFTLRALAVEAHRVTGSPYEIATGAVDIEDAHGVLDAVLDGTKPPSGDLLGAVGQIYLAHESAYLPEYLAGRIAEVIVPRLGVVRSRDRITNRAAVQEMARQPRLREALIDRMVAYAGTPHAGEVNEVLEILLTLAPERSVGVLEGLLQEGDTSSLAVADCHARHLIASRRLPTDFARALERRLSDLAPPGSGAQRDRPAGSLHAWRRLVDAVVRRHSERSGDASLLSDERAGVLVHTAIHHRNPRMQHRAALALVSGELSHSVAPAMVELAISADLGLARRASLVLKYLPDPPASIFEAMRRRVDDSFISRQLWRARGHARTQMKLDCEAHRALKDPQLGAAVVYGFAMAESSDLAAIARSDRYRETIVKQARWWTDHAPPQVA